MTKSKDKWVPVYDGDGKHTHTVNARGEWKSLGESVDTPEVVVEIRAAELAASGDPWLPTDADEAGYGAHAMGADPPDDGWAGWLEREILITGGLSDERLIDAIARLNPDICALDESNHPAPDWQKRVLEKCDEADRVLKAQSKVELKVMLDRVDQSNPAPAPETPLGEPPEPAFVPAPGNTDDEPTHVGAVDERFDSTEG